MKLSKWNLREAWNQRTKKIESIQSNTEATALLESVKEKRANSRTRSRYLTSYIPKRHERQEYIVSIGRTLDVSEGGAKLETHRQLDKGMQLELDIAVADRIISAEGKVVYSEKLRDGLFGTGISFITIDEEDRSLLTPIDL